MEVVTDVDMSVSENELLYSVLKTRILTNFPQIIELSIKTQSSIMCPLLSSKLPTKSAIEKTISAIICNNQSINRKVSFDRISVHYLNSVYANVELYLHFNDKDSKFSEIREVIKLIETDIKVSIPCVLQIRPYVEVVICE